jgi:hypothetical protein
MRDLQIALPCLMRRHNMPTHLPPLDGNVEAHWLLRFRGPGAEAWTTVPNRRTSALLTQFRQVAHSLQKALRTWMSYRYFHKIEAFASRDYALPYLVYSTMRPFYSRLKTQLTYHALEPGKIRRGLYRLDKPVARALDVAQRRLLAAGLPIAGYRPEDTTRILATMYDGIPRLLGALVNQEAYIMEELIQFSDMVHRGNEESDARGVSTFLVNAGRDLQHTVRCRLRRSLGGVSYVELTPLVLLAITAGLARAQGLPARIEAELRLRELATGRDFCASSTFWYASSGFHSTLSIHEEDSDENIPVVDDDDGIDGPGDAPTSPGCYDGSIACAPNAGCAH